MTSKLIPLLLLTFLLAHDAPLANGVTIFGQNVAGLWVRGVVACSTTGNLPGRGLAGVNVTIVCNGARTEPLAQILTDGNGVFNAILTALEGIAFDQSSAPCEAIVHTPIVGCELLGRPGLLRAVVNVAANLVQTVLGLVATTVLGPFQFVPI
nr:repetitive proline-rich cell wall protein 2-like [Ipomoea batatas]GMD48059.1 repetitive proline-rich cell wall protein 2-like [Ipomoea batatas]